jgi:hypothetical protein
VDLVMRLHTPVAAAGVGFACQLVYAPGAPWMMTTSHAFNLLSKAPKNMHRMISLLSLLAFISLAACAEAMSSAEHHLLVLDPFNPEGAAFRVILSEAWGVENNLSLANMNYAGFAPDPDRVFRGFK